MGRKKIIFTDEQRKEKKKEYNKRYRSTENGKQKTLESIIRYQETDKYYETRRKYEQKRRQKLLNL